MEHHQGDGPTAYERLGGEPGLRAIINRFVDAVVSDVMIGFFFRNVDIARLKEMEFQHAAEFLGADIVYQGRPLGVAHKRHPIMGGQFARRSQILRETLVASQVPEDIISSWLDYLETLRPLITGDKGSDCDPGAALRKTRKPLSLFKDKPKDSDDE